MAKDNELYGADCAELLKRWDEGSIVHTIEMGGMGPGYEQAIQITVFEMLRYMLANPIDWDEIEAGETYWKQYREDMDKVLFAEGAPVKKLGLSGAQYGAAVGLASKFEKDGPAGVNTDKAVEDRRIMASNSFPAVS